MAFKTGHFAQRWQYLYHLTFVENLAPIRLERRLYCAAKLMELAGANHLLNQRRETHRKLMVKGHEVYLRDQAPLHDGNIEYEPGWSFDRLMAHLNRRVFFWPGNAEGPIVYGIRHYERYKNEGPAVIRLDTARLFHANPGIEPLFCRYNSGSPRCSGGEKSPRGANTFLKACQCGFPAHEVKEVTFLGSVILPNDTQVRGHDWGGWSSLFDGISVQE